MDLARLITLYTTLTGRIRDPGHGVERYDLECREVAKRLLHRFG